MRQFYVSVIACLQSGQYRFYSRKTKKCTSFHENRGAARNEVRAQKLCAAIEPLDGRVQAVVDRGKSACDRRRQRAQRGYSAQTNQSGDQSFEHRQQVLSPMKGVEAAL
jgi:hypothetical protein